MLPITRANLQSFCRICLRELPDNSVSSKEPNHDINEDELFKVLQSISGVTMIGNKLNLYPRAICHSCFVKTNAFLKFRDKSIIATGVLKILISESLKETTLLKLKSFCRVCLRKRNTTCDSQYTTEKDGEVYRYMYKCTGLRLTDENTLTDTLGDDSRYPSHLCGKCYATLKNFMEFRGVSKHTEEYLQGLVDGVQETQWDPKKHETETEHQVKEISDNVSAKEQNSIELMEQEIVVEPLPICDLIKNEFSYDEGPSFEEIPIDIQMKAKPEVDGINLFEHEIKNEVDVNDHLNYELKDEELMNEFIINSPSKENTTNDRYVNQEFHSGISSNSSDIEDKFEKGKNKSRTTESIHDKIPANKVRRSMRSKSRFQNFENISEDSTHFSSTNDHNTTVKNTNVSEKHKAEIVKDSKSKFKCTDCNKKFYKKFMFEAHMKGVHEGIEKPFVCQHCTSSFRLVQLLNRHISAKHKVKPEFVLNDDGTLEPNLQDLHVCLYCQRPFRRKDHLKEHIRAVHEGLRPFKCKICDKAFGARNTQIRHEKNHSEMRPYACQYCSKRYNLESELKVHLQRHTTKPELLCPICKRGKPNAEELQKHIAMHEASRQHQCPKCGKVFTKLFHLREHDSAVHLKLRPFKCSYCDQTFGIRKTLRTHERRHDPFGRPEFCCKCQLYFNTKRALLLHTKKTHSKEEDIYQ